MALFKYQALSQYGELIQGEWSGSYEEFQAFLTTKKAILLSTNIKKIQLFQRKYTALVLGELCFQLANLTQNGIHLTKALKLITEQQSLPSLQKSLDNIQHLLAQGYTLSESLQADPAFPHIVVQSLIIAERTGVVLPTLEKLHRYFAWQNETLSKIKQMLRYPLLLALMLMAFFIVVFQILLPNIMLLTTSNTLPIQQNFFLESLVFLSSHPEITLYMIVIISIAIFTVFLIQHGLIKNKRIIKIFMIPHYLQMYHLSIVFRHLAMLLQVGIDLKQALQILINDFPKNTFIKHLFADICEGFTFFHATQRQHMVLPTALGMIQVAEQSGTLARTLETVSELYTSLFRQKLEKLISWTQPLLIVIMGTMLLWIVLAIFLPLYESLSGIQ